MRSDVKIPSCGLDLAGWLYVPDGMKKKETRPAIVMAHGLSAVKEMYLDAFAERFCAAGFVVTVFDYRCQGSSPGEPRGQIFPDDQHDDYRNAITWTQGLARGRRRKDRHLGLELLRWARHLRVRVRPPGQGAACQVPLVDGLENIRRLVRADIHPAFRALLNEERAARATDPGKVSYFPVVSEDCNGRRFADPRLVGVVLRDRQDPCPDLEERDDVGVGGETHRVPPRRAHPPDRPHPVPDGGGERRRADADRPGDRGVQPGP